MIFTNFYKSNTTAQRRARFFLGEKICKTYIPAKKKMWNAFDMPPELWREIIGFLEFRDTVLVHHVLKDSAVHP